VQKVTSPDAVLYRWREAANRIVTPSARPILCDRGLKPVFDCPRCGGRKPVVVDPRKVNGDRRWTCSACHAPWPREIGYLQAGSFQVSVSPGEGFSQSLAELATWGQVLDPLSVREKRIYLQLYLWESCGDYVEVARQANARWPRMHPIAADDGPRVREWGEWTVRRTIQSARDAVTIRAIRAGLWAHAPLRNLDA
jgi:hypothetical protein